MRLKDIIKWFDLTAEVCIKYISDEDEIVYQGKVYDTPWVYLDSYLPQSYGIHMITLDNHPYILIWLMTEKDYRACHSNETCEYAF